MKNLAGICAALALYTLGLGAPASADERMEVIPLRHATAEQLLPVLRPLMPEQARISGMHNQILVRADAKTIAELVKIVTSLDRPPRSLLLYVAHDEQFTRHQRGISASTRILVGDGEVVLGRPGPGTGTSVRIDHGSSSRSGASTQQIQTIEGAPALIRSGQVRPLVEHYEDAYGRVYSRVVEQDATRGVYAVARLMGNDQVLVELYSQNNRPGPGGSLQVQQADSSVRGRIGEWLDFAGDSATESGRERELTAYVSGDQQSEFSFRVRVELLD